MKFFKIYISLLIMSSYMFGELELKDYAKIKTPIENIQSVIEWKNFMKEFEMTMETHTCAESTLEQTLAAAGGMMPVGLKSKMTEVLGFVETTKKPFFFPSFNIQLKEANFYETNTYFNYSKGSSAFRSATADAHYIKAPLMGMIFKKKIKFLCFTEPEISFPFLSEFYPGWRQDKFETKVMLPYVQLMTPQGMLTAIFEIISIEVANAKRGNSNPESIDLDTIAAAPYDEHDQANQQEPLFADDDDFDAAETNQEGIVGDLAVQKKYESQSLKYVETIFNSIVYMFGADFITIGGYIDGDDPVTDAQKISWTLINKMAALGSLSGIQKQTNRDVTGGFNVNATPSQDTMCRPRYYPVGIQSQYSFQQAYPVIGSSKEGGTMGIHYTGKNRATAEGVSYILWSRRDYAALAYNCPFKGN